jgi:hypothetical protein
MLGLAPKKKSSAIPAETGSMSSTQMPSWMSGEAPTTPPKKKKPRVDSGGQLSRFSQRMA